MRKLTLGWLLIPALLAGCGSGPPPINIEGVLQKFIDFLKAQNVTMSYPAGQPTQHSSAAVPDKVPDEPGTDIVRAGVAARFLDAEDIAEIEAQFPEGQGPEAYTVFGDSMQALAPGFYYFPFLETEGDIPTGDNGRVYQYATVFDRDNDTSNNYFPIPAFPNDFFINTDGWLQYRNDQGNLSVTLTDARDSNPIQIPTTARAFIARNLLMWMVAATELDVMPCYRPQYRSTAFCHGGDFGINAPHDWSGSVKPGQHEPLATPSTEERLAITPRMRIRVDYLGVDPSFRDNLNLALLANFFDTPLGPSSVSPPHMSTVVAGSDLIGGKDGGLNVIPAMAEKGTLFPCLRLSPTPSPNPTSGFVSFPFLEDFMLSPGSFTPGPMELDDGLGTAIPAETTVQDSVDIYGEFLDAVAASNLIADAMAIPGNVHFVKELEVYDGQIANVMLRNEMGNVSDLRPDFRSAVEAYDPMATEVKAGLPLHIYTHANLDLSGYMMDLRLDTRSVALEKTDPVEVDGVQYRAIVPFTQTGRLRASIDFAFGETVLLGGQRNAGETTIQAGVPILSEIPFDNRPFAAFSEIPPNKVVIILIRPQVIFDRE